MLPRSYLKTFKNVVDSRGGRTKHVSTALTQQYFAHLSKSHIVFVSKQGSVRDELQDDSAAAPHLGIPSTTLCWVVSLATAESGVPQTTPGDKFSFVHCASLFEKVSGALQGDVPSSARILNQVRVLTVPENVIEATFVATEDVWTDDNTSPVLFHALDTLADTVENTQGAEGPLSLRYFSEVAEKQMVQLAGSETGCEEALYRVSKRSSLLLITPTLFLMELKSVALSSVPSRLILVKAFCQQATDVPATTKRFSEDMIMELSFNDFRRTNNWDYSGHHVDGLGFHLLLMSAESSKMLYIPLTFMSPFCPYHLAQLVSIGESRISTSAFNSLKRVFDEHLIKSLKINSWCLERQREGSVDSGGSTPSQATLLHGQPLLTIEPPVTVTSSDDWATSCYFQGEKYRKALAALKAVYRAISQSIELNFDALFADILAFYASMPTLLIGDSRGCVRLLKLIRHPNSSLSYEWVKTIYRHTEPLPVLLLLPLFCPSASHDSILIQLGVSVLLVVRLLTDAELEQIERARSDEKEAQVTPSSSVKTSSSMTSSLVGLLRFNAAKPVDTQSNTSRPGTSMSIKKPQPEPSPFQLLCPKIDLGPTEIMCIHSTKWTETGSVFISQSGMLPEAREMVLVAMRSGFVIPIAVLDTGAVVMSTQKLTLPTSDCKSFLLFKDYFVTRAKLDTLTFYQNQALFGDARYSTPIHELRLRKTFDIVDIVKSGSELSLIGLIEEKLPEPLVTSNDQLGSGELRPKKHLWNVTSMMTYALSPTLQCFETSSLEDPTVWLYHQIECLRTADVSKVAQVFTTDLSFTSLIFYCLGLFPGRSNDSIEMTCLSSVLYPEKTYEQSVKADAPFADLASDADFKSQFQPSAVESTCLRLLGLLLVSCGSPVCEKNKAYTVTSHFFEGFWRAQGSVCNFSKEEALVRDALLLLSKSPAELGLALMRPQVETELKQLMNSRQNVTPLASAFKGLATALACLAEACQVMSSHVSSNLRIVFQAMGTHAQDCLGELHQRPEPFQGRDSETFIQSFNKIKDVNDTFNIAGVMLLGWIELNLMNYCWTEDRSVLEYLSLLVTDFSSVLQLVSDTAADLFLEYEQDGLFLKLCQSTGLFDQGFERYLLNYLDPDAALSLLETFCQAIATSSRLRKIFPRMSPVMGISQYQSVFQNLSPALPLLFEARPQQLGRLVSRYPLFAASLFVGSDFYDATWSLIGNDSLGLLDSWLSMALSAITGFVFLTETLRFEETDQSPVHFNHQIVLDLFMDDGYQGIRTSADITCQDVPSAYATHHHYAALLISTVLLNLVSLCVEQGDTASVCVTLNRELCVDTQGQFVLDDTGHEAKQYKVSDWLELFLQSIWAFQIENSLLETLYQTTFNFLYRSQEGATVMNKRARVKSLWKALSMSWQNTDTTRKPPALAKYVDPVLLSGIGSNGRTSLTWLFTRYWKAQGGDKDVNDHRTVNLSLMASSRKLLFDYISTQCSSTSLKTRSRETLFLYFIKSEMIEVMSCLCQVAYQPHICLISVMLDELELATLWAQAVSPPQHLVSMFVASQLNDVRKLNEARRALWLNLSKYWLMALVEASLADSIESMLTVLLFNSMCGKADSLDYLDFDKRGKCVLDPAVCLSPIVAEVIREEEPHQTDEILSAFASAPFDLMHKIAQDSGGCAPSFTLAGCGVLVDTLLDNAPKHLIDRIQASLWKAINYLHKESWKVAEAAHEVYNRKMEEDMDAQFQKVEPQPSKQVMSFNHALCDLCEHKVAEAPGWIAMAQSQASLSSGWDAVLRYEIQLLKSKAFVMDCGHVIHAMCCRLARLQYSDDPTKRKYRLYLEELFKLSQSTDIKKDVISKHKSGNEKRSADPKSDIRYGDLFESLQELLTEECPLCGYAAADVSRV